MLSDLRQCVTQTALKLSNINPLNVYRKHELLKCFTLELGWKHEVEKIVTYCVKCLSQITFFYRVGVSNENFRGLG